MVPSTRIAGTVVGPDGGPLRGGTLSVALASPATALDPDTGTRVTIVGAIVAPIGDDGSVALSLIPTADLTPQSSYVATFAGPDGSSRLENWIVPSSSTPLALGDVPRC